MPSKRNSGSSPAQGHKSATDRAKPATQAPTIQKRPSRPRAMAAVQEATRRLTTRGRPGSHSPDPSPSSHISVVGTDRIEALERENASLKLSVDAITDSLDEVKEMLQALATDIKGGSAQGQGATLGTASVSGPRLFVGMTPEKTIHTLLPWVDATTLANVVACTLDVAHFIKLIPLEQ